MNKNKSIEWLLTGPPWVQYLTRVDLLGQSEKEPEVTKARQSITAHPQVKALIKELADWPGPAIKRHNDAGHLLHKLVFIADMGIKASDPGVDEIIKKIIKNQSKEGAFQTIANVPTHFGGSGKDEPGWMLCDAPSILYSLVRMGVGENPAVKAAAEHLASLSFESGWPCTVAPEFGRFRGPGRKTDPCPYATLISLKALAQLPEWRENKACLTGAEALLGLWEQRKERKPYLFGMGTDFKKLKAPMVWYDILHVLEVLTQFPSFYKDKRLLEMADIIKAKADSEGRFTAESVWKAWPGWEFGQKKEPSYWITLQAQRILKRIS
jgi:hypothetical protein